jgi:hypothetical protein
MSSPHAARPVNGRSMNGTRTVDWSGYPALFQRVAPAAKAAAPASHAVETCRAVEEVTVPAPVIGQAGGVREALLGFCQAALFAPATGPHSGRPSEAAAAGRALAAAEAFGFTREEVRRLGCGLYAGPAAVREDLRGVGFTDEQIDAARLCCDDAGRPRAELAGCLVVPLTDEHGRLCDFLFLTVGETGRSFVGYRYLYGPAKSGVVAFGLSLRETRDERRGSRENAHGSRSPDSGLRPLDSHLVLVEDVIDALLLQCRGLHHVAAIGGPGREFSPRRWEELARLGVSSVTLAFRRDDRHAGSVRDALVSALRARTAPEVFVANPYPAGERSAADVLRRFGKDTCAAALSARSLAFHDKDFGAAGRERGTGGGEGSGDTVRSVTVPRRPTPAPAEPYHRTAYRKHVAELAAALPSEDRSIAEQVSVAVEAAILAGDFGTGFRAIGDAPAAPEVPAAPVAPPAPVAAPAGRWFWVTGPGGYATPASAPSAAPAAAPANWTPSAAAWTVWPAPAPPAPVQPAPAAWTTPACWPLPQTEGGRAVLTGLRDWLRRESETARG